jgi:sugar phosphate isomerase/epimerase
MKLGICANVCPESLVDEAVRVAASLKLEGMEVPAGEPHLPEAHDPDRVSAVKRVLDACGVRAIGLRTDFRIGAQAPASRRSVQLDEITRTALLLGAGLITVRCGAPAAGEETSDALRRAADELAALGGRAADSGLRVAVEMRWDSLARDSAGALSLMELAAMDNLGIAYEPCFAPSGEDPAERIAAVLPRTFVVHVQDRKGAARESVPLGQGDGDLPAVLAALKASAYDGWVVLVSAAGTPSQRPAAVRDDLAYLRAALGDRLAS